MGTVNFAFHEIIISNWNFGFCNFVWLDINNSDILEVLKESEALDK